ncbi:translation initiation factor [Synechococcus sp. PCC 7336]|uniref:translation initiation factor n=1 Tax=Synechococcus sp. PCC 7336 TaxID=195250 RepID=UPI00034B1BA7|nr:translation initiation factor [Synechococcus sp. PCC 7336]
MSSSKRRASQPTDPSGKRIVYSEFGSDLAYPPLDRPSPELPPEQQQLRIQTSRKGRKGKTVTLISGFQSKPETLATLLKQLKSLCGAGGTVKEMTIEIQGDHRDRILQKLRQLRYSVR